MNEKNTFYTETDGKYAMSRDLKVISLAFLAIALAACYTLTVSIGSFLLFETMVIIPYLIILLMKNKSRHIFEFRFEGDRLLITDRIKGNTFDVSGLPASSFKITQSKKEAELDYCTMQIKGASLVFAGVKDCGALREYIKNNYKDN